MTILGVVLILIVLLAIVYNTPRIKATAIKENAIKAAAWLTLGIGALMLNSTMTTNALDNNSLKDEIVLMVVVCSIVICSVFFMMYSIYFIKSLYDNTATKKSQCRLSQATSLSKKTIYISGAISNDNRFKSKFKRAQRYLEALGYWVMSPAILPQGFLTERYLPICYAMIDFCSYFYALADWKESVGAQAEMQYAKAKGKIIIIEEQERKADFELLLAAEGNAKYDKS